MIRLFAAILLSVALVGPALAEEPPLAPDIVGVRVGFAGHYKVGLWTPVEVTLRGGPQSLEGQLVLTVPDGDGVPSRYTVPAKGTCHLRAGHETQVTAYVKFGRVRSALNVEFRAADQTLARRTFQAGASADRSHFPPALLSGQELMVEVSAAGMGTREAAGSIERHADEKADVVRLSDASQLPDKWFGYEGVDAILLSTSEPKLYDSLKPDGPQVAALQQWIRMGGKLVLSVGREAEQVLKPGSPLARFAPGSLEKTIPLRHTAALETYAASSIAITAADGRRPELHVPLLADLSGVIEARENKVPLIVRQPFGFGQIVFVAVDLDRAPLADWTDRGLLVRKLLDMPVSVIEESNDNRAVMHFGFADMAGQLRSALDHFRGIRLAPFSLVVVIVIGYILAIGAGDYFFLRKFLRRMELTWVTFPLIVLAVCLGAYLLTGWLKGNRVLVNQIDLVDVDAQSGRLRGTAWANVFSPKTDRYNLAFQARSLGGGKLRDAEVLASWLGLPGEALGGMNPKTAEPMVWKGQYSIAPELDRLDGEPIQIGATKSLTARWTAPADVVPKAEIRSEDRLPVGEITNTLDFALTDCVLAYGNWAYELGTIGPGQSVQVGPMLKRRELRTLLTGRKVVFEKDEKLREEVTPYDQSSVDLAYILRAMMFFQAAGGSHYTGLLNRYQPFVDLSNLLKTDRAILVAMVAPAKEAERHGAVLLRDGQPLADARNRHKTIYRFVFPVRPEGGEGR
jgi:hypothetical protein